MRPKSIVQFERLFILTIVLGALSSIWSWLHWQDLMPAGTPAQTAAMMPTIMGATLVIGILINLLLLFFIARKGSEVAKWIFVVFFALGLLSVVRSLTGGAMQLPLLMRLLSLVQIALEAGCVWLVFRPDATRWFKGERSTDLNDTFS
jgi:uncharacterized membrane protein